MSVNIHGKEYVTVSERLTKLHSDKENKNLCITTEVLQHSPIVVIKATVSINGNMFTGISAANPSKAIEKQSPYEVAETSAVGRALGFAGFEIERGFATAEEMVKAGATEVANEVSEAFDQSSEDMPDVTPTSLGVCRRCGKKNIVYKSGTVGCSDYCWKTKQS